MKYGKHMEIFKKVKGKSVYELSESPEYYGQCLSYVTLKTVQKEFNS